jgi:hypothetical protein
LLVVFCQLWQGVTDNLLSASIQTGAREEQHGSQQILLLITRCT